jgi:hypothetical protein
VGAEVKCSLRVQLSALFRVPELVGGVASVAETSMARRVTEPRQACCATGPLRGPTAGPSAPGWPSSRESRISEVALHSASVKSVIQELELFSERGPRLSTLRGSPASGAVRTIMSLHAISDQWFYSA